ASLGAMTLYVIPSEIVARLRVVTSSLVTSLFPSLSEHNASAEVGARARLYSESLKYILLILLPCFLLLGIFGSDIISLWIGPDYAASGGMVLKILSAGGLLNALGFVPSAALVALGRPDLPAKFHLIELPLYLLLSIVLIPRWGIAGAAFAVACRLAGDAIALLWAAHRYVQCNFRFQSVGRVLGLNAGVVCAFLLVRTLTFVPLIRLAECAGCLLSYLAISWFFVLSDSERPFVTRVLQMSSRSA
ncbi:MAG: polysaccharide biosynthesis C-terminal domain-containing protein, partial [Terriglobales bacterium]